MKGFKRDILSQRLIIITRYEKGSEVRVCYRRTYTVLWRLDGSIVESLKCCKWMQRLIFFNPQESNVVSLLFMRRKNLYCFSYFKR